VPIPPQEYAPMRRVRLIVFAAGLAALALGLSPRPADAQPAGQWATVKGHVVFPADKPIPERKKLEVSQDKEHCLSKGAIVAESGPIEYKCSIHPWMNGYVRIFDHPYYAVTDENGNFEIKNAPAGKWRMIVWQEKVGYLGGKEGRFGTPIEITAPATELKPF